MRLMSSACLATVLVATSFSSAQVGPELLLNPFRGETRIDGVLSATYFLDTNTDFGSFDDIDAQIARYHAASRYKLMPEHRADPRIGFLINHMTVETDGDVLPKSFTDLQIGFGTGIAEFDGWVAGLVLGFGWAGANEFHDGSAYYGAATVMFGRQLDENTSLGIALDYNGNRSFMPDVPLPGIVWTRKLPEEKLEVSLGFPFAYGRWRPTDKLLLELNFTFPDFVGGQISYDLMDGVGLYASLTSRIDAWHSNDLPNDLDRIFFQQSSAEIGARISIHEQFILLIAGGYAFDQEFSTGFDTRDTDEIVELDNSLFFRLEGQISF